MSKLGSIITSALPVATVLICQRACICVGVWLNRVGCVRCSTGEYSGWGVGIDFTDSR
jgi:hypothetical protein